MHVAKKTAIAKEATWRGQRQHSVRDGARAKTRPATGHLFHGGGCEIAGVKQIKIYHYAKDAVNPLPLRKWCNDSRGSFFIQKELIGCMRNMMTSINLKQHYNVKTRKAVTPTYHRTEFGSNPVWL